MLQTSKRLGAGARMRRIDVAALYVQELERQKHVKVGKFLAETCMISCQRCPRCPHIAHLSSQRKPVKGTLI